MTTHKPYQRPTTTHKRFINNSNNNYCTNIKTTRKPSPTIRSIARHPIIMPITYHLDRVSSGNLYSPATISRALPFQLTPMATRKYVVPCRLHITSTKTRNPHYPILKSVSSTWSNSPESPTNPVKSIKIQAR